MAERNEVMTMADPDDKIHPPEDGGQDDETIFPDDGVFADA